MPTRRAPPWTAVAAVASMAKSKARVSPTTTASAGPSATTVTPRWPRASVTPAPAQTTAVDPGAKQRRRRLGRGDELPGCRRRCPRRPVGRPARPRWAGRCWWRRGRRCRRPAAGRWRPRRREWVGRASQMTPSRSITQVPRSASVTWSCWQTGQAGLVIRSSSCSGDGSGDTSGDPARRRLVLVTRLGPRRGATGAAAGPRAGGGPRCGSPAR